MVQVFCFHPGIYLKGYLLRWDPGYNQLAVLQASSLSCAVSPALPAAAASGGAATENVPGPEGATTPQAGEEEPKSGEHLSSLENQGLQQRRVSLCHGEMGAGSMSWSLWI